MAKTDVTGEWEWDLTYSSINEFNSGHAIIQPENGSFVFAETTRTPDRSEWSNNSWLVKIDAHKVEKCSKALCSNLYLKRNLKSFFNNRYQYKLMVICALTVPKIHFRAIIVILVSIAFIVYIAVAKLRSTHIKQCTWIS
ncbi:MAG: hypothetical protein ACE5I5_00040 [Candidatus Heimdallarchaeota archaeon]